VRECAEATEAFVAEHDGLDLLLRLAGAASTPLRARRKALFLLLFLFDRVGAPCLAASLPLACAVLRELLSSPELGGDDTDSRCFALQARFIVAAARRARCS